MGKCFLEEFVNMGYCVGEGLPEQYEQGLNNSVIFLHQFLLQQFFTPICFTAKNLHLFTPKYLYFLHQFCLHQFFTPISFTTIFYSNLFNSKNFAFFTPIFLQQFFYSNLFNSKNFAFFTPIFLQQNFTFFYTTIFVFFAGIFLQQKFYFFLHYNFTFFYTKIFVFFTRIFLQQKFYFFLHKNFCIFYTNFFTPKKVFSNWCKKAKHWCKHGGLYLIFTYYSGCVLDCGKTFGNAMDECTGLGGQEEFQCVSKGMGNFFRCADVCQSL